MMTSTLMDRLGRFLILCTFGCLTLGVFEGSAIAAQASLEQVPDGVACARCRVDRRTAGASLSLDRSPVAVSGPCFRTRCYLLGRRPASPLRFVRGCGHETDSVLRTGPRAVAPSIPGSRLAPDGATPRRIHRNGQAVPVPLTHLGRRGVAPLGARATLAVVSGQRRRKHWNSEPATDARNHRH